MKKRSNVISVPRHLSNCAILPRSATNNSLLYYFSLSYYTLLHIICYTYSTVYYTITVQYYSILYVKTGNIVPFGLPKGKVPKYVKKSLVFYQVNIEENVFYLAPDSPLFFFVNHRFDQTSTSLLQCHWDVIVFYWCLSSSRFPLFGQPLHNSWLLLQCLRAPQMRRHSSSFYAIVLPLSQLASHITYFPKLLPELNRQVQNKCSLKYSMSSQYVYKYKPKDKISQPPAIWFYPASTTGYMSPREGLLISSGQASI